MRTRAFRTLALACWFAGVATASHGAPPTTVTDDRGVAHTWARPPQRIVSLLPSLTESVCALGACERLVATDRFSNWPAGVSALPKLGGLDDAPVEAIVALRPDLVLVAPSARVGARLEALGIAVVAFQSDTHADVRRTLQGLAAVLGVPGEGAAVWARIQRTLQAARDRVPAALEGQRVYFEIDPAPYAAGAGSFVGETLAALGLGNVAPATMGPFPRLNPEFVVRVQPDIVIASRAELERMVQRPGWAGLRALARHRVCAFADESFELLIRPGPRLGDAATQLADCLAGIDSIGLARTSR